MWRFLRSLLFLFSAETAHNLAIFALCWAARLRFPLPFLRALYAPQKRANVEAMGLHFPSRVGLAAGLDKNAVACDALLALGFGFVEIGSVTDQPQPGNPKPRLFRLPSDRALLNRMGFNNDGADVVAARLRRGRDGIVGVNIGKTKVVPETEAIADYVASTEKLAPHADYLVVNVSSPNTPGLRDLQSVEKLRPLLVAVQETLTQINARRPLLVKIAPDLADQDILDIVDLACDLGLSGLVLTNTTIARSGLKTPAIDSLGAGGISGAPLKERSLSVLRLVAARAAGRLCLISVGGIETSQDVAVRIEAGATLVQIYSAFIYEGPALLKRLT